MSYKIEIVEEAELEIKNAKDWYEEQSVGLGEGFSKAIKEHINSLTNPKVEHKTVYKNLRRILVHRFPYAIYYKRDEKNSLLKIMAVLHNKQSRKVLKKRSV